MAVSRRKTRKNGGGHCSSRQCTNQEQPPFQEPDIVRNFTANNSYIIVSLIKKYKSLIYSISYEKNKIEQIKIMNEANIYKNTILAILKDVRFNPSSIVDASTLLLDIIEIDDDLILSAYMELQHPEITQMMIQEIKTYMTNLNHRNNNYLKKFNGAIKKMILKKENFPNIRQFLDEAEVKYAKPPRQKGQRQTPKPESSSQEEPPRQRPIQSQQPVVNNYVELQNYTGNNCPSNNKIPIDCEGNKTAYFKQALIFHPDKNTDCKENATVKFQRLGMLCSSVKGGTKRKKKRTRKNKYMKNKTKRT
jgi:hypothetical protein